MQPRLRRRALVAATSLAMLLGTSACASTPLSQSANQDRPLATPRLSPAAAIRQAVDASEGRSARFVARMRGMVSGVPTGGGASTDVPVDMRMRGAVDPATRVMKMRVHMDSGPMAGVMRQIVTPKAMYVSGMRIPDGKWVKVPLTGSSPLAKALDYSTMSPSQSMQLLEDAADLRRVGTDRVRGETATHYSGTLDVETFLDKAGQQFPFPRSMFRQLKFSDIPLDIWIGRDKYVRKLVEHVRVTSRQGVSIDMTMRMEMFDYGTPVTVTPPPAKDLVPMPRAPRTVDG